jgi:transmembrane sensor
MSPDPVSLEWIDRYLSGELSPDEQHGAIERIARDPELRAMIGRLQEPEVEARMSAERVSAARDAILQSIRTPATEREQLVPRSSRSLPSQRRYITATHAFWAIAATLLVTLGVWKIDLPQAPRPQSNAPAVIREVTTARGERARVRLDDGSELVLAPASKLRLLATGDSLRLIELEGAAMFTVVHDVRKPFVVRTRETTVRDVGTVFGVTAYGGSHSSEIVVAEGEVDVGSAGYGQARLRANDLARVDSVGRVERRNGVDARTYLDAIERRRLVFEGVMLRDAFATIEREFDVDIEMVDSALAPRLVRGTFTDLQLSQILDDLATALGTSYEKVGKRVRFGTSGSRHSEQRKR